MDDGLGAAPQATGSIAALDALETPQGPVEAALRRSAILADMRRLSPEDPRVRAVFDTDALVAEDQRTGIVVTASMVRARADVFDRLLMLLGRPVLTRGQRSWLAVRIANAFEVLSPAAQLEWSMGEVRRAEIDRMMGQRSDDDLSALASQLDAIVDAADLWAGARALAIAARVATGKTTPAVADPLEPMAELAAA